MKLVSLLLFLPIAAHADAGAVSESAPIVASTLPPRASPQMTLPRGKLNVTLTLELDASASRVAEPVSIAPDISYGVTRDLTLALLHSKFGLTGLRAVAGGGLCLTGTDGGCGGTYNNVGAEAWYSIARGRFAAAAVGGVHAVDIDRGFVVAKIGARLRQALGDKLALNMLPSVLIALDKRTAAMGSPVNKDLFYVPLLVTYQVTRPVVLGLGTGIKGPVSGLADGWQIPLGVTGQYAIGPRLGVGASWVFGQLLGGATNPPDPAPAVKGPDLRGIQVWGSYSM